MLSNPSADTITGTLYVEQHDHPSAQCSAQVDLPPHSHKLYTLYVEFGSYGGQVPVILARDNNTICSVNINPSYTSPEEIKVVSIGDPTSSPNYLSGEKIKLQRRVLRRTAPLPRL